MQLVTSWDPVYATRAESESYLGRGEVSDKASMSLGCEFLPDSNRMWRTAGAIAEDVATCAQELGKTSNEFEFFALNTKGGSIIQQCGGVYPAIGSLQQRDISSPHSALIAEKLRNDMRARRIFLRPTMELTPETPIYATTPPKSRENPYRTMSTDRR